MRTRSAGKPRILVFTDSRGQLKPGFSDRLIFPERIKAELEARGTRVDLILCPFKWTSTIDFIELIETGLIDVERYRRIVLYTGVVDWSPRPISSFRACMKGTTREPLDLKTFKRKKPPPKVANHKLAFFRRFFGTRAYNAHARTCFKTEYRGEPTINLYSLPMLEDRVIPYLRQLGDKLIFVNSNRLVPGWEGDYTIKNPDGRPHNIRLIEDYAQRMSTSFDCVDLLKWSSRQIKRFTTDNMHLSWAGSEWIAARLLKRL